MLDAQILPREQQEGIAQLRKRRGMTKLANQDATNDAIIFVQLVFVDSEYKTVLSARGITENKMPS